jgi:hypothetical protein
MADQTPKRKLFKRPFVFASQLYTSGGGQIINGGAVVAGDTRTFPADSFKNALDRPFFVTRVKVFVGRVAGGDEVDSDYDASLLEVRDLVTNEEWQLDPVPLSALLDHQRREWLFGEAKRFIRKNGGGLTSRATVNAGAVGAPFNWSIAFHGYTESIAEPPEGFFPEEV